MSEAEELLNSLSNDATAYTSRPSEEPHIVIGDDRIISVPESLQRIAVQFDHNVETVTFDCPRYWDDNDISEMYIYINYLRKDGIRGRYLAKNVVVDSADSNMIHFDWTISNEITAIDGKLVFSICAVITNDEGFEERHWNSEINTQMTVSGGLECTEVIPNEYPDIVTDLLARMDSVVAANTPILDKSLMQAGLAADAKSAGDAIRAIDDRVTQISEGSEFTEIIGNPIQIDVVSKNKCIVTPVGPAIEQNGTPSLSNPISVLGMGSMEEINILKIENLDGKTVDGVTTTFEKTSATLNGTSTGANSFVGAPDYSMTTSKKIGTFDKGTYTFSIRTSGIINYSDGQCGNYLRGNDNTAVASIINSKFVGNETYSTTFTLDTAKDLYLQFYVNTTGWTFDDFKIDYQIEKGSTVTKYTPNGYARTEIQHCNNNIFNKNDKFTNGYLVMGEVKTASGWKVTDFIPIPDNVEILTILNGWGQSETHCFYDENKEFVGYYIAPTNVTNAKIPLKDNYKYLRATISVDNHDDFMLAFDDTDDYVEPLSETFNLDLPIGMVLYDGDMIYEKDGEWIWRKEKYYTHVFKGDEIANLTTSYTNVVRYKTKIPCKYVNDTTNVYCNYLKGDNKLAGQDTECITIHTDKYLQLNLAKSYYGSTVTEANNKLKALYDSGTPMYAVVLLSEPDEEVITDSTLISQLNELSTMTTHKGINNFVLTSAGKDGLMKLEYKLYNLIGYEDIEEFDIDISELKRQMGDVSSVLNKINGEEV